VGALAGVTAFFAGGLIVIGLGQVVLFAIGLAGIGGAITLIRSLVSREDVVRVISAVRRPRASAPAAADAVLPPTADELYGWPYAGSSEAAQVQRPAEPRVDEERQRAVELNVHGTRMRRSGSPAAAAALHLEALEILQSLDDDAAQAPTLNSLALALAAKGDTDAAVERFEQSLSILRERPDDPGQAEVTANLGFTHLRQGDHEHARELLSEALEKLPPDSRAAHKVEAALRRAS
jgi:tetratricopeptide (TPR) repeat protein